MPTPLSFHSFFADWSAHSRLCVSGALPANAVRKTKSVETWWFVSRYSQLSENVGNRDFWWISKFCWSIKNDSELFKILLINKKMIVNCSKFCWSIKNNRGLFKILLINKKWHMDIQYFIDQQNFVREDYVFSNQYILKNHTYY